MSERDDDKPAAPGRFHMDRAEEVADAQERFQRDSTAPPPTPFARRQLGSQTAGAAAPVISAKPAAPAAPVEAVRRPALDAARAITAVAALALVSAFFYPAIHDALDRDHHILRLTRDGRAAPAAPAVVPRVHLSINATPRDAIVTIDGADAGTSPMMTSVPCDAGQNIRVVISAPGYRDSVGDVACLPGQTVEVSPVLERESARP